MLNRNILLFLQVTNLSKGYVTVPVEFPSYLKATNLSRGSFSKMSLFYDESYQSFQGTVPVKFPSYYLKVTNLSRGKLPIFLESLLLAPEEFPCLKVTNFSRGSSTIPGEFPSYNLK